MQRQYTVVLKRDESKGHAVALPALKGCVAEGATLAEVINNAQETIVCYLGSPTRVKRDG